MSRHRFCPFSSVGPSLSLVLICCLLVIGLEANEFHDEQTRRVAYTVIDFEPPDYPLGSLPDPWQVEVAGDGYAQVTSSAAYEGDQCLALRGWAPAGSSVRARADYPLMIDPATGNVTIRTMIRPSLYEPGSNDAGFVTLGGFFVSNDLRNSNFSETSVYGYILELRVEFRMSKPAGQPLDPSHLSLVVGNHYSTLGSLGGFTRGGYHEVIATWDYAADKVYVTIVLPDGTEYHRTLDSGQRPLRSLLLFGQTAPTIPDPCRYDKISFLIATPAHYLINLMCEPEEGGTVEGGGFHLDGATVTAVAHPAPGYSFFAWKEDSVIVSMEESYQFTVTSDRTLVANFVPTVSTLWAFY